MDPYQEATDLIEEYNRRKGQEALFGTGGFTTISSFDEKYVRTVIEEIKCRGYTVHEGTNGCITISE